MIHNKRITLTAAQIATANSVPIDILGAPSAGTVRMCLAITESFNFNTTPFDTSGTLKYYGDGLGVNPLFDGQINVNSVSDKSLPVKKHEPNQTPVALSTKLTIIGTTDNTSGDSSMTIDITYEDIVTD